MSATDDDLALVGAILQQRWRLVRVVGSGGIGVVYEAVFVAGGGFVAAGGPGAAGGPASATGRFAVKILRRELADDPAVVSRFLGEASASARVAHPGVIHTVDQGRAEDGTPYLVLPLLEGECLSQVMNRGRVPVQRATSIAVGLLDALAAAHAAGVVHRDLKPDNVFLVPGPGGTEQVRILDFGLARVVDAAGGPARRTRTGMLLGTPGYMSPEQVQNAKEAGPHADLWSLAVILFEMLTGARAYVASNEFERLTKVLMEASPSIAAVAPQYAHWESFFMRALAREPQARFPDAASLRHALEQVARGERLGGAGTTLAIPSVPPSALSSTSPPRSPGPFGGVATALSPGAGPSSPPGVTSHPPPNVTVVQAAPRGFSLPYVVGLATIAWVVGLAMGYLLGAR